MPDKNQSALSWSLQFSALLTSHRALHSIMEVTFATTALHNLNTPSRQELNIYPGEKCISFFSRPQMVMVWEPYLPPEMQRPSRTIIPNSMLSHW